MPTKHPAVMTMPHSAASNEARSAAFDKTSSDAFDKTPSDAFDKASSDAFDKAFRQHLTRKTQAESDIQPTVQAILRAVQKEGDHALRRLTQKYDGHTMLRIPLALRDKVAKRLDNDTQHALTLAARRIERFHRLGLPEDIALTSDGFSHDHDPAQNNPAGVLQWGARWTPVDAAGVYVPGGRAAYPSSLLMAAIPAFVAGVARVIVSVPVPVPALQPAPTAPDLPKSSGEVEEAVAAALSPAVMAVASMLGIDELYAIGGAQAIAAMAYGTETVPKVDMITGPGNSYVAMAKQLVFGEVGIDAIAGPSEVLIVADATANPEWLAWDLLAQAEHDPTAQSILVTTHPPHIEHVKQAIENILSTLPRAEIAAASWENHGLIVACSSLDDAICLANRAAPEHLELAVDDPHALLPAIRHAGSIFLGHHTPEALGDYIAGPNHVLPTSGAARFGSGLSARDYLKRTTLLACPPSGVAVLGEACATLADAEGLHAHAASMRARLARADR